MSPRQEQDGPDRAEQPGDVPNPETGVGIGAGAPSTFEPEEDEEGAVQEP